MADEDDKTDGTNETGETDETGESDERRRVIPPPIFGPPDSDVLAAPTTPAQHGASAESAGGQGSPDQVLQRGQSPEAASQHGAGPESAGGQGSPDQVLQHGQSPEVASQHGAGTESAGGHGTPDQVLQRGQSPEVASQHAPGDALQGAGEPAGHHGDLQPPKPRARRWLERAAQRPRGVALIAGGAVAVTVATIAIVVAVQNEPAQPEVAAATTTTIVVATTEADPAPAPPTTAAPRPTAVPTTAAASTTEAPTTTEATTTTTVASFAGTYTVTTSGFTLTAPDIGFSQEIPSSSGTMVLDGPCDGVGPCHGSFGEGIAATPTGTAGDGDNPFSSVDMTVSAPGTYGATLVFANDPVCGASITADLVLIVGAAPSGSIEFDFPGSGGDCPAVNWAFTFTSVPTG